MSRNWTKISCLAVRHLNHYTKLFSVLVWDWNSIIFMHQWFCPIHLIRRKSLHFEKKTRLFLHLSVILFTEVVSASGSRGCTSPGRHTPKQTSPWTDPFPPPPDGHWSGRYASHWNAFLLESFLKLTVSSSYETNHTKSNAPLLQADTPTPGQTPPPPLEMTTAADGN